MKKPISIVIADSQVLVRVGLKYLLSNPDQYDILGEAKNEKELFQRLDKDHPDVLILDYNQPDNFSHQTLDLIRKKFPQTNVLVISADNDKKAIYQVLESGVNSFLTKTCDEVEILDAVTATAKGEKFYCTRIIDYLLEKSFAKEEEEDCSPTPLSPREVEIVRLIAKGLIAKEIADVLSLSTHTIYTHRKNIMKKLNINSSSELILYALNNGLVSQESI
jgi:DNA-binding NarL/FixJ family response regulator